jgi:hypothetical protein
MTSRSRRIALAGIAALLVAAFLGLVPTSALAAPALTLESPGVGETTGARATFSGTTSDAVDAVTLLLYAGGSATGTPVRTLTAHPSLAGTWSVQVAGGGEALETGTYTAEAEQSELELLGGLLGETATAGPVTFAVHAEPPVVTIVAPPSRSSSRTPSFSGAAGEATEVVVHVLSGAEEVASAKTTAGGGKWSTTTLSKALPAGRHSFTAYATEKSGLGNEEGESGHVSFEVDTEAPVVTLLTGPPARSNDTEPGFSGKASEETEVVVHVLLGSEEVASAKTTASAGAWSTTSLNKPLPQGTHTFKAYATEKSGIGNEAGESEPISFEVDTEVPTVTIKAPARSNNTTPSFSGTASENTEVVVHVKRGSEEIATATTTASGGKWTTPALAEALPGGENTFTAYATEKSSVGNQAGESEPVSFEVDTEPPHVAITGGTGGSDPSFSGTASEDTEVVVHVKVGSEEYETAKTTASGGSWSTSPLAKGLPGGRHEISAYATEKSGIGNGNGTSETTSYELDTEPPTVTINQPPSPSNNTDPSFSGTASESTEVTVHVMLGSEEVAKAKTTAAGGKWSTGALSKALASGEHSFTAFATEKSGLGNAEGESESVPFVVDTNVPTVTIKAPASPSNNTDPSFSGTASESTEVVVHVLLGSEEVASAKTTASGGKWSTGALSKALSGGEHTFTAYATEKSGAGNGEGESGHVSFEVDTLPPTVTMAPPASPSNNTDPSFSGTASENSEVVVHVLSGTEEVASAKTTASGGKWSTGALSKALPSGRHSFSAYATEKSGLGNESGESGLAFFEVDTLAPSVTVGQPPSPSNNTEPAFSGTASENTEVVVHVLLGGEEVAKAKTTASGGKWATGSLSKALPSGDNSFTAYATEKSGLGNAEGESTTVSFVVDTNVPTVTIKAPPPLTNNTEPSFSGTASESTEVVVHVMLGSEEVASAHTTPSGGKWSTAGVSPALPAGKHSFKAFATQKSTLGNGEGESATVSFEVDTEPPTVTIEAPPAVTGSTEPSFSGTASEATEVTVHVLEGTEEVASSKTLASGGRWASGALSKPLPAGKHAFTVYATEKSGLGNGEGESSHDPFAVNTLAPTVTIVQPPTPTNDTTPTFSGAASENTEVVVRVKLGSEEVASAKTTASGGKWTTGSLSKALPGGEHTFTAVASEKSGLGNPQGESSSVSFVVDTNVPTVTIKAPASPSNNTTPSFSGEASENTEVVVHVKLGSEEVASAKSTAAGGKWSTGSLSKALPTGRHSFTAYATEKSGLGNAEGESEHVSFEVNTEVPTVTISQPVTPSNNTSPVFSGAASENTEVVVHVLSGSEEVASAKTVASGGAWSAGALSKALADGRHTYTAYATEKSGVGNAEGESKHVTFEVDTEAPSVSINQPPSPSDDTNPSFSGEASENTEVVVHVKLGSEEVASAKTTASGGKWSTGALSATLPAGDHTFTAYATEKSGLGNEEGKSSHVSFEVDTLAPTVAITGAPAALSNDTNPTFSGTASESTEVVVHVLLGKEEVASAKTTTSGGKWTTSGLSKALAGGKHAFTAYATEKSGLGNEEGKSSSVAFEVNTNPPAVALIEAPEGTSGNTTPSFGGTASEETEVEVHVFLGSEEVAHGSTSAAVGVWSVPTLNKPLASGKHTFTAYATEKSGLGNGPGKSNTVTFTVNTNAPTVTLEAPASPSDNTNPSFSGEASEDTEVVVHVKLGSEEVASAKTTASSGKWSTSGLSKALPAGKHAFTAYAIEKSGLGNETGQSGTVSFEVNTLPPVVTITGAPPALSNNTNPSFSGEASETTEVVVHVKLGSEEVASAKTTAAGGKWSTSGLAKALPAGKHAFTAYATEKSALGNAEAESSHVSFEVDTEPPTVTVIAPTRSNDTTPTFSGSASENTEVVVHVKLGSEEVASARTTAAGGAWTAGSLSKALPAGNHTFTAYATEKSGLGNAEGESTHVSFEVDTEPPLVALTPPSSPTSSTDPSFSGTASENTEVVVHVKLGSEEVASAKAVASEGKWSTTGLSKALASGKHIYSVVATEKSGIGNKDGESLSYSLEVNTVAPTVTIAAVASPTNNTNPSFSGEASENTEVVVHVKLGSEEVASAKTTASGGKWTTGGLSKTLPGGKHSFSAYATEKSGLGNEEGKSSSTPFEVNTEAPVVKIESGPPALSNNTQPAFAGSASENTEVVVHVKLGGEEVASARTTAAGGKWSTGSLNKALPSGRHSFTAYATERSGLGNGEGESEHRAFEVDTEPPILKLAPLARSNNTTPAFNGETSEGGEVVVHVLLGSEEVASAKVTASAGKWTTGAVNKALAGGEHVYTAYATEKSSLGNEEGKTEKSNFTVDTNPPSVTIGQPVSPSNNTNPSFSGTGSEEGTEVVVHVLLGSEEVANAKTTVASGKWSTGSLSKALTSGKHSFTAYAVEKSGIGNKEGESAKLPFEVNTEAPKVTINLPATPSNVIKPTFTGSASENTEVTVHVFNGSEEILKGSTIAASGAWSVSSITLPTGKHTLKATATEKSGLGNKEGEATTSPFEVNTEAPVVTINQPPAISNESNPAFSGTASERTPVAVQVFAGPAAEGTPVATLEATPASNGKWESARLTTPLGNGEYTAVASEASALGNAPGKSPAVSFKVATGAPVVTIEAFASPTKNTQPKFTGTVSSTGGSPVTVYVYEGRGRGKLTAEVTATVRSGRWETAPLPSRLAEGDHIYTVVATAPSTVHGDPEGESASRELVIDTAPPVVALDALPSPSNIRTPAFKGTSDEPTTGEASDVVVSVYSGPTATGTPVAKVTGAAGSSGAWETAHIAEPLADGQYTAIARQQSGIGNGLGTSGPTTFTIDTKAPAVTLKTFPTPSSRRTPSFSGTASDGTPVTVTIYAGGAASGPPVQTVSAETVGGEWFSGAIATPLEWGEYTAVASQPSSITGNPEGVTAPFTFVVAQIPPTVQTEGASAVTETSAALFGSVNPLGGPITRCAIEVGRTSAYGRSIGCGFVSGELAFPPEANGLVPVFIRIYGLTPNATYHYRVAATGEGGSAAGADQTFTTPPAEGSAPSSHGPPPTGKSSGPSSTEVASYFAQQLAPRGKAARIGMLLKSGQYKMAITSHEAGTMTVDWYYLPRGAKLSALKSHKKGAPVPVLVASGRLTLHAAGKGTIKLSVTAAGRRLLKASKRLKLTATFTFQAPGSAPISVSGTFVLTR